MPLGLSYPPLGRLSLAVVRPDSCHTSPDDTATEFKALQGGGASFSSVSGLDGAVLEKDAASCLQSLHREGLIDLEDERLAALTWGALAEAGTHRRLWLDAAQRCCPVLVLDSAAASSARCCRHTGSFARDLEGVMRSLPENWDMLALSWSAGTEVELSSPSVPGVRFRITADSSNTSTNASSASDTDSTTSHLGGPSILQAHSLEGLSRSYILSSLGAEKMLKASSRIHCSVEEALKSQLPQLAAYACFPPLLLPANPGGVNDPVTKAISEEVRHRRIGTLLPPPPTAIVRETNEATQEPAVLWQVVGGRGFGGIIVRAEAGLSSQLLGRLQCGAILEQEDREGGRIHFKKLSACDGPNRGWVSISSQGKELLQTLPASVAAGMQQQQHRSLLPSSSSSSSPGKFGGGSLSSAEQRWRQQADDRRRSAVKLYEQRKIEAELELCREGKDPEAAAAPLGRRIALEMDSLHEDHHHDEADISEMWASGDIEQAWWLDSGGCNGNGKRNRRSSKYGDDTDSPRTMKTTSSIHIPDYDPDEPHGLVPPAPPLAAAGSSITSAQGAHTGHDSTDVCDAESVSNIRMNNRDLSEEGKSKQFGSKGHSSPHTFQLDDDDDDDCHDDHHNDHDDQDRARVDRPPEEFSFLDEDDLRGDLVQSTPPDDKDMGAKRLDRLQELHGLSFDIPAG